MCKPRRQLVDAPIASVLPATWRKTCARWSECIGNARFWTVRCSRGFRVVMTTTPSTNSRCAARSFNLAQCIRPLAQPGVQRWTGLSMTTSRWRVGGFDPPIRHRKRLTEASAYQWVCARTECLCERAFHFRADATRVLRRKTYVERFRG